MICYFDYISNTEALDPCQLIIEVLSKHKLLSRFNLPAILNHKLNKRHNRLTTDTRSHLPDLSHASTF